MFPKGLGAVFRRLTLKAGTVQQGQRSQTGFKAGIIFDKADSGCVAEDGNGLVSVLQPAVETASDQRLSEQRFGNGNVVQRRENNNRRSGKASG